MLRVRGYHCAKPPLNSWLGWEILLRNAARVPATNDHLTPMALRLCRKRYGYFGRVPSSARLILGEDGVPDMSRPRSCISEISSDPYSCAVALDERSLATDGSVKRSPPRTSRLLPTGIYSAIWPPGPMASTPITSSLSIVTSTVRRRSVTKVPRPTALAEPPPRALASNCYLNPAGDRAVATAGDAP